MRSTAPYAAFVFAYGRRHHTFALNGWCLAGLAIILPLFSALFMGAMAYCVWHDELLASLVTHQSEMQYAYEDRIAGLKVSLDEATTRGNADRFTLETGLRDLALKSQRLETRAATIDDLVQRLTPGSAHVRDAAPPQPRLATPAQFDGSNGGGSLPASNALRLEDHADAGVADENAAGSRTLNAALTIDRLADRQNRIMASLVGPATRSVQRMTAALTNAGLSLDRWRSLSSDVGGPFIPLPASSRNFDQSAALLRDAVLQQARLTALITTVPLRRPLTGPLEVTSGFGARLDPFYGRPAMHTGVDLREAWGEAVTATASGTVTIAGIDGGYGNLVEIDHGNGLRTRYAHLGTIGVKVDQKVVAGAVVGHVGSTGRATGPHLHYEVRIDGEPVDPSRFLKAGAELFPG